ncbi:MAG: hypothetical protein U1E73_14150 [Planctomycetota bacterium]
MITLDRLALRLGVNVRSLVRWRAIGLRLPRQGESFTAWSRYVDAWRLKRRRRPGPARRSGTGDADMMLLRLRAEKLTIAIGQLRGELHTRDECDALRDARTAEIVAAFDGLPDRLARRLFGAPSPERIAIDVESELRLCFSVLVGDEDAEEAIPPTPRRPRRTKQTDSSSGEK